MNAQKKPIRLDLTSSALQGDDAAEIVQRSLAAAAGHDVEIGIQMHNTAAPDEVERMHRFGLPLSFHAPTGGE